MSRTAAAYIRVSTNDQMEYSPDSQLEKIREYAAKNGMVLPDRFIFREDEGISGKTAKKRPEFMRMIGTAKRKPRPFDVIIVWKFSRFARSRQDSIVYKSMLRKQCGVDVVSVTEPIGDDKLSILVEAMIEAMDEYYSINLAEEVRRGMSEKVARGEPVTAPAFGYRIRDKEYQVDPDAAPFVRMIFRDFLGGMSARAVAAKLNAMGVRTKRGGLWESRTVEYVLRNPVYIGKIRWNPKRKTRRNSDDPDTIVTDSRHEPLLKQATWQAAQARMAKNRRIYGKSTGQEKPDAAMLQGLVKCSSCGSSLVRSGKGSMQCTGYAHGICGVSHEIQTFRLEEMVLAFLEADLKDREIALVRRPPPAADCPADGILEKQITREQQKLSRVKDAYADGTDTLAEYRENKRRILNRIAELSVRQPPPGLPPVSDETGPQRFDILALLRSPTVRAEQKNAILRSFIRKIVFDRRKSSLEIFYYL